MPGGYEALSHKGMGITEAEWNIFMPHIAAALDSVGVIRQNTGPSF